MPGASTLRPISTNLNQKTEIYGKISQSDISQLAESMKRNQSSQKLGKSPTFGNLSLNDRYNDEEQMFANPGAFRDKGVNLSNRGSYTPRGSFSSGFSYKQQKAYLNRSINSISPQRSTAAGSQTFSNISHRSTAQVQRLTGRKFITEQQQIIQPHLFQKTVDVTETMPMPATIETWEPVKVIKNVPYTKLVPVVKQIQVWEPRLVVKEVEVMEPRLVTKEIQVIENVTVKKMVEIIENRSIMREVESFEPRTFTKQVEVNDFTPVMKQVTVTEPVHLKKFIEFMEPVITTKTVTKELQEAVVVDEKITTTTGPASLKESEIIVGEKKIVSSYNNEMIIKEKNVLNTDHYYEEVISQESKIEGNKNYENSFEIDWQEFEKLDYKEKERIRKERFQKRKEARNLFDPLGQN